MSPLVLIVGAAFLLVSLIVFGAYWLLVAQPETQQKTKLHKRLKVNAGALGPEATTTKLEKGTGDEDKSSLDEFVGKMSIVGPIQKLIKQADLKLSVGVFMLLSLACFTVTYGLIWYALRYHLVALAVGFLAMFVPLFYVKHQRNKRFWKFEEQFPDAIDLIARARCARAMRLPQPWPWWPMRFPHRLARSSDSCMTDRTTGCRWTRHCGTWPTAFPCWTPDSS